MGGPEKTRQLLDEARKIAIADGLAGIYFQGMNPWSEKAAKLLSDAGFDCIGSYNLATCPAALACEKDGSFTFDYSEMLPWHQKCWKEYSAGATVPYIPAVTAGRDVTMRCRNEEPFPWRTVRYPYGYICLGNTPDKFQSLLETAKKHVEADPKAPRAILIYGWNEYTEGGYIAPNNFDADGFLRAVAAVFGRKPASEYTYVNPSTKQLFTIPSATYENIPYGPHPKQKIDVFLPGRARAPRAPVVIYLHGGGWSGGAMEDHILGSSIRMLLNRGIAVVGTGYRYIRDAQADGVKPPVMGCLDDCENALRFVKAHATEWNLDVSHIGLAGGSAGACTALYLALKDDNMHGIRAVAPIIAQTSMDPQEMKEWIPNSRYGAHAFGYRNFADWLAHRAECLADIERISPAALARKIDPARAPQIFLQYGSPLKPGEIAKDPTHSPVFGERFRARSWQAFLFPRAMNDEIKHRMTRRLNGWDYCQRAIYMITITLADRSHEWLGKLILAKNGEAQHYLASDGTARNRGAVAAHSCAAIPATCGGAYIEPTPYGEAVIEALMEMPRLFPQVEIIAKQLMPEHFHFIIFVHEPLPKPLGALIRGFKAGVAKRWKILAKNGEAQHHIAKNGEAPSAFPAWADGFQDTILFRDGQLKAMIAYLRDNPRRLAEKRAVPDLFRRVASIALPLDGGRMTGHFEAIGNRHLLARPLHHVQCSRRFFAYRRIPKAGGGLKIARDAADEPIAASTSPEYGERLADALAAAAHGAVIIRPCISDGERQIAREALKRNLPLVTLQNKGFARLHKPVGRYFDACAEGRLLMMAPAAWPYTPQEKPMTRFDATALNRLCQWLVGEDALDINYHGMKPANIDQLAKAAAQVEECKNPAQHPADLV